MNETFILVYLLINSQSRLKIELMNLVKNRMPLPIYLNRFSHIFNIEDKGTFFN